MNKLFAPFLPPWAETGLQPAFYDLESGTVLQQTARMYAKVQQLTRLFNELSEETKTTVEEYIAKFVELKDFVDTYFENLDVQEEINNKLDAMAEAGTLADIISEYLNSIAIFGFDTVALMKNANNLIDGSYARTMGYYAKNDGGGALYKIRTITNDDVVDNSFIIAMTTSPDLIAELVYTDNVNTKQLGVIDLDDATAKVQALIDKSINDGFILEFGNEEIRVSSIDFKTAKLKFNDTKFVAIGDSDDTCIEITNPYKGCLYSNFSVIGNGSTGIDIEGGKNIELSKVYVYNCKTGIKCTSGYEITIKDSLINNSEDIVDSVGLSIANDDSNFVDIVIQGFRTGVKTTSWAFGNYYERIHVWNIVADTVKNSVGFDVYNDINLSDCVIDTCLTGIKVNRNGRISVQGCRWFWNTEYYNDTIVENHPTRLFEFASADTTENVNVQNCYGFKPTGTSVLQFSNLEVTDWKSLCDVKNSNTGFTYGVAKKPYGYITSFTTPESLTDNTNKIISTQSGVVIDYIGKIASDATIGDLNIGTLETNCRPEYSINSFCAYGAQWDNPDGVAYLFVNSGGAVAIKVNSAMLGKFIKVHFVIPR